MKNCRGGSEGVRSGGRYEDEMQAKLTGRTVKREEVRKGEGQTDRHKTKERSLDLLIRLSPVEVASILIRY